MPSAVSRPACLPFTELAPHSGALSGQEESGRAASSLRALERVCRADRGHHGPLPPCTISTFVSLSVFCTLLPTSCASTWADRETVLGFVLERSSQAEHTDTRHPLSLASGTSQDIKGLLRPPEATPPGSPSPLLPCDVAENRSESMGSCVSAAKGWA